MAEPVARTGRPHNNALHQTRRRGVAASRPVVEGRLAGERECSTGEGAWKLGRYILVSSHGAATVLLAIAIASCASAPTNRRVSDSDVRVRRLLDSARSTGSEEKQQAAFDKILALGCAAVPALGKSLADERHMKEHSLRLVNRAPNAFEGFRHYSPVTVSDAAVALLGQLTSFTLRGGQSDVVRAWEAYSAATPFEKMCIP